jgi:hypothetical protein
MKLRSTVHLDPMEIEFKKLKHEEGKEVNGEQVKEDIE